MIVPLGLILIYKVWISLFLWEILLINSIEKVVITLVIFPHFLILMKHTTFSRHSILLEVIVPKLVFFLFTPVILIRSVKLSLLGIHGFEIILVGITRIHHKLLIVELKLV